MQKDTQPRADDRERKRARFHSKDATPSGAKRLALVAAVLVLAAVGAAIYFLPGAPDAGPPSAPMGVPRASGTAAAPAGGTSAASAPVLAPEGDAIRIPASSITRQASFFKTEAAGTVVPFFAIRGRSGEAVVALDACSVCAHAKRGYEQRGDAMLCKNCGMTFPVDHLARMGGQGGCHPITVPSRVEGESIVIDGKSLAAGAKWFS